MNEICRNWFQILDNRQHRTVNSKRRKYVRCALWHPWFLHGITFWILTQGFRGSWSSLNLQNRALKSEELWRKRILEICIDLPSVCCWIIMYVCAEWNQIKQLLGCRSQIISRAHTKLRGSVMQNREISFGTRGIL